MYKLACQNLRFFGFFACAVSLVAAAGDRGRAVVSPNAMQHAVEVVLPTSDPDALVNIPDAVLRRAVEEELGKDEGESISRRDMADLSTLSVSGDVGRLAGLEHAVNLVSFYCYCVLNGNDISDLTPLASLDVLTTLYIWGCGVSDVTPLSELRSLRTLTLGRNDITDVTPLAGLDDLEYLNFSLNAVFDLSAVNGLHSLKELNVYANYISDITPLESLDTLTDLNLQRNGISDIDVLSRLSMLSNLNLKENHIVDVDPLIENESLGAGAVVDLRHNPLSLNALETGIPLLQEKGVDVRFDPPESSTDIGKDL